METEIENAIIADNSYKELEGLIEKWAEEKGILGKATPIKQAEKTLEEVRELMQAITLENKEEVVDALGDILVTIIIQAKMQGLDLLECLRTAYGVISKRKGEMIDGFFVKNN